MKKTTFKVAQMDCSSEEQMIRMKLEDIKGIQLLDFDIPNRKLEVYYDDGFSEIEEALDSLNMSSSLESTEEAGEKPLTDKKKEKKILRWVLGINVTFFVVEMTGGWLANSMGLIADSLDMLADASVYGLSLFVVGTAAASKKKVAKISVYLQMGLALLGSAEVIRRFFATTEMPEFNWMIIIALLALAANIVSLWLINKAKSREAHMRASSVFTSNDIIVNGGVIVAGIFVYLTGSKWPDLIIGAIVFSFVMRGAITILNLSK